MKIATKAKILFNNFLYSIAYFFLVFFDNYLSFLSVLNLRNNLSKFSRDRGFFDLLFRKIEIFRVSQEKTVDWRIFFLLIIVISFTKKSLNHWKDILKEDKISLLRKFFDPGTKIILEIYLIKKISKNLQTDLHLFFLSIFSAYLILEIFYNNKKIEEEKIKIESKELIPLKTLAIYFIFQGNLEFNWNVFFLCKSTEKIIFNTRKIFSWLPKSNNDRK